MKFIPSSITAFIALSATNNVATASDPVNDCYGEIITINETTKLDLYNSEITNNTLHLDGGELRYSNIGIVRDKPVDLVVTVESGDYTDIEQVWKDRNKIPDEQNGKNGAFGKLNMQTVKNNPTSGKGNFKFCFRDTESNDLTKVDTFRWTVFDFDERGDDKTKDGIGAKEKMLMDTSQARLYQLWPNEQESEIKLSCEDGSAVPCSSGIRTVFHSSTAGTGKDNPIDPDNMTNLQKTRSVTFTFQDIDCWTFTYDHYCPVEQDYDVIFPFAYDPAYNDWKKPENHNNKWNKNECRGYDGGNFLFSGDADEIISEGECITPPPTTASPTDEPTAEPTNNPTVKPTESPTATPTKNPTLLPTASPTKTPTATPTAVPTKSPTASPTASPTKDPTAAPTKNPTVSPTASPTKSPTLSPTDTPTKVPTAFPTSSPTDYPTKMPSPQPSASPTKEPTLSPTKSPTASPTNNPTAAPTKSPTGSPTTSPTDSPSMSHSDSPTTSPSASPTKSSTVSPTVSPTKSPTVSPTASPTKTPTNAPTSSPTKSMMPTDCFEPAPPKVVESVCMTTDGKPMDVVPMPDNGVVVSNNQIDGNNGLGLTVTQAWKDEAGLAVRSGFDQCVVKGNLTLGSSEDIEGECIEGTASLTVVVYLDDYFDPEDCEACNVDDLADLGGDYEFCAYVVEVPCEPVSVECGVPTSEPSNSPTKAPTAAPTNSPTKEPTNEPTDSPSASPSGSFYPSSSPSDTPTSSMYPSSSPTDVPTKAPTPGPTKNPTLSPTVSPTAAPTKEPTTSPTVSPTKSPTGTPTKSPTASPTVSPTKVPTAEPTLSPTVKVTTQPPIDTNGGDDDDDDDLIFEPTCPEDLELVVHKGQTDIDLDRVVKIVSQDTSTVKVSLNQGWDRSSGVNNEDNVPIDHIYYSFRPDTFDEKCYEETSVMEDTVFDTVTIQCHVYKPYALLEICVVDDLKNGLLTVEDDANVPKCCHPTFQPETPTVCYTIKINCVTECVDDNDGDNNIINNVRQRGLRGSHQK